MLKKIYVRMKFVYIQINTKVLHLILYELLNDSEINKPKN